PWTALELLACAGFLIYAAGIIFNDLADLARDRQKRPERALPSGQISVGAAIAAAAVLMGAGVALGFYAGPRAGEAAATLAAAVLLYDFVLKRWSVTAAIGMGLCRALNLAMGLALPLMALVDSGQAIPKMAWLPIPVGYGLLIAFLTSLSWSEEAFPIKLSRPWAKSAEPAEPGSLGSIPVPVGPPTPQPVGAAKPSLRTPKISFWLWVGTLVFLSALGTSALTGNPMLTLPGAIQLVSELGVFGLVYMRFSIFLGTPIRANLGLTIRNGVLSIPLMWVGLVFAYGTHDPRWARLPFPNLYELLAVLLAALYLPLMTAVKWLQTKDA
ncbi:MAG: UbiA family prenyltransferase, partial [Planctomycetota bacterium]